MNAGVLGTWYWLVVIFGVAPSSGMEAPGAEMDVFWLMVGSLAEKHTYSRHVDLYS